MMIKEKAVIDNKEDLFVTMRSQIDSIAGTPEEVSKIEDMLRVAEEQSRNKVIKITREPDPTKKFLTLWRNRFHYGIHWKKPLYPFRLARNVIKGKIYNLLGKKKFVLRGISFNGTYKCNFNCNHCLCAQLEESDNRKEMEPKDYKRIVKEAMKLGALGYDIAGGEPFVSPIWEDIVKACRAKYNYVFISTNGFMFNEKRAKRCAELGVTTIYFSLDSGYPELHDLFRRKKGSFEKVMNGIKLCRKYGLKVILTVVVHKDNLYTDHFRGVLEIGEREKILINTKFAKVVGNFKDKNVMLDQDDIKAFEKIVEPYNFVQRHLYNNYGKQCGCPGTKENLIITPYGDILNCAEMHVYLGNVMEEPLKDVRERALKETPFGCYHSCFLTEDPAFMNVYYNKMRNASHMTTKELKDGIRDYEEKHNTVVYPDFCTKE